MRITPLDVRKQEFRKGMRGLDPEEVYAFLATVADEYEMVLNDNKALRERLLELDDKVQEYRSMEKTLRDTLFTAERVNVEAKENARREASIIVKEAQIEADKALRDIRTEAMKLRTQVSQLRGQRDSFLSRMKVVAESHLNYIKSAVDDFRHEDVDLDDVTDGQLADGAVEHDDVAVIDAPPRSVEAPSPRPVTAPAQTQPVLDTAAPTQTTTPATPTRASAPTTTPTASGTTPTPPAPAAPSTPRVLDAGRVGPNPGSVGPNPGSVGPNPDSVGPDPITMIIDRMKRGQQEILQAGSGAPGIPGAEAQPPLQPQPKRQAETGSVVARESETLDLDTLEEDAVAVATSGVERKDAPAGNGNDVTRELRLDDIRREIAARENTES